MIKRIIKSSCLILSLVMLLNCGMLFSYAKGNDNLHTYMFENGEVINYLIDSEGNPFHFVDGEKRYILLPLEKFEVKDVSTINWLNSNKNDSSTVFYSSTNSSLGSLKYSQKITLSNTNIYYTPQIAYNSSKVALRVKTTNHSCGLPINKCISFIHYYYNSTNNKWYSMSFVNKDCSNYAGFAFEHSPSVFTKGYFGVLSYNTLKSCTFSVYEF